MAKIKIIWDDDSVSYVSKYANATQFLEQAEEYKTILTAERVARIYLYNNSSIKEIRIIDEDIKEYCVF